MAKFSSTSIMAQVVDADARNHRGLLQRGMSLGGDVGDDAAVASFFVADVVSGTFASREQRAECRTGCRILNHAAAGFR